MSDVPTGARPDIEVRWLCAFVDLPPQVVDATELFWSTVAGQPLGTPSGDDHEFVPLRPADGDPHLWFQHIRSSEAGVHPDLSVSDLARAAEKAIDSFGATLVHESDRLVSLRSPGGLPFCLVALGEERRPSAAAEWPEGASMVDQLCIDVPSTLVDRETRFWAELTGWRLRDREDSEFTTLTSDDDLPMRILLQRLDDPTGPVRAHLDLASEARDAEVARHRRLGALPVRRMAGWTTLRDPAGLEYCVTDRRPARRAGRRGSTEVEPSS